MSIEEFTETIQLLSKKLGYITKRLMILGGEPFLHPQLIDFIKIARQYMPESTHIDVLTNGIALDKNIDFYSNLAVEQNVGFVVTPYPLNYNNLFKQSYPNIGFMATRLTYQWPQVDLSGAQSNSYANCPVYTLPCFIIRDKKIHMCPFSACIHCFSDTFNQSIYPIEQDYLDLNTVDEEQLINFISKGPEHICQFCHHSNNNNSYYWHQGVNKLQDYNLSRRQLYFNNYKKYEQLVLGNEIYDTLSQIKNQNQSLLNFLDDLYYSTGFDHYQLNRRQKSKIDIIIPYKDINQQMIFNLYNNLLELQDNDTIFIYFISNKSTQDDLIWNYFEQWQNVIFLKENESEGPGVARNKGLENSYGETIFFLDVDDLIYNTKQSLESLYNNLKNYDFIAGEIYLCEDDKQTLLSPNTMFHGILIKRELINKYQIKFSNLFINEDRIFESLLILYSKENFTIINTPVYIYNRNSNTSIAKNLNEYEISLNGFLSICDLMNLYLQAFQKYNYTDKERIIFYCNYLFNGGDWPPGIDNLFNETDELKINAFCSIILYSYIFWHKFNNFLFPIIKENFDSFNNQLNNLGKIIYQLVLNSNFNYQIINQNFTNINDYLQFWEKNIYPKIQNKFILQAFKERKDMLYEQFNNNS